MSASLRVEELVVTYGDTMVLDHLSLTVSAGRSLAITGPSGSGKSSLLDVIIGAQRPASGLVEIGSTRITDLNEAGRATFRRTRIGLLFQAPELLPELSVIENVALIQLFDGQPRDEALANARLSLDPLGVGEHADKRIDEISGGEAQRVALTRALARPGQELLVADEPTASLDARNAGIVTKLLVSRSRELGITTIVATHDPQVAAAMDDSIDLRDLATATTSA